MSQLFKVRLTARGPAEAAQEFKEFIANEWLEMSKGNGILNGFSHVPKVAPVPKQQSTGGNAQLTFDFSADGRTPGLYAIAVSAKFPLLRFALMTADASSCEWLALAIASFRGAFACAHFKRGKEGCPSAYDDGKLLSFLSAQVPRLDALISADGRILEVGANAPFKNLEVGAIPG